MDQKTKHSNSNSFPYIMLDIESRFGTAVFVILLLIPVLTTLAFGSVDMWAVGLIGAVTSLVLCLWAIDSLRRGVFRLRLDRLQIPIAALILLGIIQLLPLRGSVNDAAQGFDVSTALSLDPFATQMFVVKMILLLVYFAAVLTYTDTAKRFRSIVTGIVIFGSVMAFFGIIQKLAIPSDGIYGIRPTPFAIPFGSFVNQHHFAAFMEMTIGIAVGLLIGKGVKKDKRTLLWIAVFVMGLALVYTSSRGGVLSLVGVILFSMMVFLFCPDKTETVNSSDSENKILGKIGLKAVSLVFGAIFLFLLAISFVGADSFFLRGIGLGDTVDDVTGGRSHFWSSGLQIFYENPIIGVGFESFNDAFTKFDTWNGTYQLEYAHNEYLQMLADGGILGFICIAAFIFLLFKTALNKISTTTDLFERGAVIGASAGCFGIAIHSFFDFPLRTFSNSYLLMLLAAIIVLGGTYIPRKK